MLSVSSTAFSLVVTVCIVAEPESAGPDPANVARRDVTRPSTVGEAKRPLSTTSPDSLVISINADAEPFCTNDGNGPSSLAALRQPAVITARAETNTHRGNMRSPF